MACRFPGADDPEAFWQDIRNGVDRVGEIPRDRWRWEDVFGDPKTEPNKTNSRWGGFIDGIDQFDPLFFQMSPAEANFVDPQHRLFLETAWRAVEDAGYRVSDLAGRPIGVYAGVSKNDYAEMLGPELPAFVSTGTVHSILANRVSFLFNLRGPSVPFDTACSSSLVALHYAVRDLLDGTCEAALVGGVNALLSPRMYISHAKSGMLSPRGRCRTFDADADGYVRGEGVGVVLLKPLDRAIADGDRIRGVIRATAINHGGRANFMTAPNVPAQREVVLRALRAAEIDPRSIRYIEAHGTGTPLGDPIEIEALKQAFAERLGDLGVTVTAESCGIGSVKTNIGHLESAAGMASLFKALAVLQHREIPPLVHFQSMNPNIDLAGSPFFLADGTDRPAADGTEPWRAGISGFGMGGVNAHVIVEEAPRTVPTPRPDGPLLFVFSARRDRLRALLAAHLAHFRSAAGRDANPADVAYTLMFGRDLFEERCAFVASDITELAEVIEAFLEGRQSDAGSSAEARDWVRSGDLKLDRSKAPGRRIALPGYPFARRSCWFTPRQAAPAPSAPVVDRIEIPADDPVLRDHRVQGVRHLPGVAYLQKVVERIGAAEAVEVSDVYWLQPLAVPDGAVRAELELAVSSDRTFVFRSDIDHCCGTVRASTPETFVVPIAEAIGRCADRLEAAEIYARLAGSGLGYGPTFRVLAGIHLGANEAVAMVDRQAGDGGAGPWDAALQAAALLSIRNGSAAGAQFVPFHVERFQHQGDLKKLAFVYVRQRALAGTGAVIGFDIDCCDRDGVCLAFFRDFTKRCYIHAATEAPSAIDVAPSALQHYRVTSRVSAPEAATDPTPLLIDATPDDHAAVQRALGRSVRNIASDGEMFGQPDWESQPCLIFAREPGEADLLRLLGIAQRLIAARPRSLVRLKYLADLRDSAVAPAFFAAAGFARTLNVENPRLQLDVVGFRDEWQASGWLAEARHSTSALHAAEWSGAERRELAVEPVSPLPRDGALPMRRGGTCLFAGGAGGLGRIVGRWLVETCQAKLVLIGRRPADATLTAWIAELEALGGEVRYLQADVADRRQVDAAVAATRQMFGAIHAVAHAVGSIEDSFILRKEAASFSRVLRPKMLGALHLDAATAQDDLDLFVCFSSVAALMPNQGQCDYASANAYLDLFAAERARLVAAGTRRGVSLSLNLPLLADGGIKVGRAEEAHLLAEFGMQPLPSQAATALLDNAIALARAGQATQILGITGDRAKIAEHLHVASEAATLDLRDLVARDMAVVLAEQFRQSPPNFGPGVSLRDFGLDSVATARLTERLNQVLGLSLKPILLFEEDRPEQLVDILLARHRAELEAGFSRLGAIAPLHRTHGLIDPEQSDSAAGLFRRRVTNDEFYMVDHVVGGQFNVPGACYLELAREAGALFRPDLPVIRLLDALWIRQLSSPGPAFDVCIELQDKKGGQSSYEIFSEGTDGSRTVHATGLLVHGAVLPSPADLPLAAIRARCPRQRSRDEVYRQIHAEGLHVGPSFMPMSDIVLSDSEALARLQLPQAVAESWGDYLLHPTLLTGVFQTALINNRDQDQSAREFIPVAIGAVDIYGLVPPVCFVHSTLRSRSSGGDVVKFDVQVADIDGRVVLALHDFTIMAHAGATTEARPPIAADSPNPSATLQVLADCIAPVIGLPASEIEPHVPFKDYGINSLMVMDLNRRVEEVFGRGLSKTLFFEYQNLAELAAYFASVATPSDKPVVIPPPIEVRAPLPAKPEPVRAAPQPPASADANAIAIVGMAFRFPQARTADAFWQVLSEGRDCIERMSADRAALDGTPAGQRPWGGFLDGVDRFDPLFFNITPREAEQTDPQERLFLEVAWQALEDAGYTRAALASRKVGVFAGALWQPYLELGLQARANGHAVAPSSLLYSIANRVSYVCDFHGPSLAIDTACSSSLTALHLACQSLASGESDVALAGGVNLSLGASKQLFLSQNHFLASDGRCRSFGAGGDGYVPGEGVAVVLLQKLDAARAAGRRIHGVIRSTAINHGGKTHGYTVPNPRAQASVIREAMQRAGIDPRTVSYLEAHGTGTELGDPIEITALTEAYRDRTADTGFCAIGSVKSNFGHLEAAAGVAGLIKVLLQLRHRSLVPSLHSATTNPHIDFGRTPFVVQQRVEPWQRPVVDGVERPRLAGISSFGAGGSNSHVLVEEFETPAPVPSRDDRWIVPLSAQQPDRLRAIVSNLLDALADFSDDDLPSLAYTLQTGREAFECRAAFVVDTVEALRAQLDRFLAGEGAAGSVRASDPLLRLLRRDGDMAVLVAQWMARRDLAKLEEAWRLGVDIDWSVLWPAPPGILSLPGYPFAPERHWLPQGVAVRTSSVGGRLHPMLHENISRPGVQRYRSVFTADEPVFADHRVGDRNMLPGAAYLAMAQAAAHDVSAAGPQRCIELLDVVWQRPCTLVDGEATLRLTIAMTGADDASFEIQPDTTADDQTPFCRGAIRWSWPPVPASIDVRALQTANAVRQTGAACYQQFSQHGLHYGPSHQGIDFADRTDSGVLVRLRASADDGQMLVPGILDSAFQSTLLSMLEGDGVAPLPVSVDRVVVHGSTSRAAYAWTRHPQSGGSSRGFDIDLLSEAGDVLVSLQGFQLRQPHREKSRDTPLLAPVWQMQPEIPPCEEAARCRAQSLLVIGQADALTERLAAPFAAVTRRAVDELRPDDLSGIDHVLWRIDEPADETAAATWEGAQRVFHGLQVLLQAGLGKRRVEWTILTGRAGPDVAACQALLRTAAMEHPTWAMRIVEIGGDDADIPESVLHLSAERPVPMRRVDQGDWLRLALLPLAQPDAFDAMPTPLRRGGVYLVIGGAGGIGTAWSDWAIRRVDARIVWVGRRPLSGGIQKQIDRLGQIGTPPLYIQADATDPDALRRVRDEANARWGAVHGIVHSALVLDDASLEAMSRTQFDRVMAAKADTCRAVEAAFEDRPPELVLFFSSINAFAAPAGQGNYAAASCFADRFAERLARRWPSTVKTINWGYWADAGVVATPAYRARMFGLGFGSVEPETGFRALDVLLRSTLPQIAFVPSQPGDPATRAFHASGRAGPVVEGQVLETGQAGIAQAAKIMVPVAGDAIVDVVIREMAPLLGVAPTDIDPQGRLVESGLDAAGLLALRSRLQTVLPNGFPVERLTSESAPIDFLEGTRPTASIALDRNEAAGEALLRRLVRALLAEAGLWDALPSTAPAHLQQWHAETRRQLAAMTPETSAVLWPSWRALAAPTGEAAVPSRFQAYAQLLEHTLPALPDILRGTVRPTDVLFPRGSLREVERVYQGNTVARALNDRLASAAVALLDAHRQAYPERPFRIIEIGAGTGATSEAVFRAFDDAGVAPDSYVYTDLSPAFLTAAADRYGKHRPYVSFAAFDIETIAWDHPTVVPAQFDLVIATNVLHATRRIRTTIANAKALLRPNGALLLHELTRADLFNHLSFGLLAGWWAFQDRARLAGSPLLSAERWLDLLAQAGFHDARRLGQDTPDPGQAAFVAESDGAIVRTVVEPARQAPPPTMVVTPQPSRPDAILVFARDAVATVTRMPLQRLRDDEPFDSYGVDSIVRIALHAELERVCGSLPRTLLFEHASIAEVTAYLAAHHAEKFAVAAEPPPTVLPGAVAKQASVDPVVRQPSAYEPIAIIGMSGRYPQAANLAELWQRLVAGQNCITEAPADRWDLDAMGTTAHGGFIADADRFDHALFRLSADEAVLLAPEVRLFLETAWLTFENAGYGLSRLKDLQRAQPGGTGVFVASMYHEARSADAGQGATDTNLTDWMIANRVSHFFDLGGPSLAINTACSGGLTAIHLACESLRSGSCAMALAGGVNLTLDPSKFATLQRLGLLASGDASKSFGRGDGFLPGEGVGAVLLKPLQRALADGDRIEALILGSQINHSGGRQSFFAPEPKAQARLLVEMLRKANVPADSIGYIEAAANGSEIADAVEVAAVADALGTAARARPCAIGAVKSNLGHLEAASGVSQVAKVVLQMQHRTLVPSLFATPPNPHLRLDRAGLEVQQTLAPWPAEAGPRRAIVNSFGAGGSYAALLLEEFRPENAAAVMLAGPELFAVSGPDRAVLRRRLVQFEALVCDSPETDLRSLATTLRALDAPFAHRTAIVAASRDDLLMGLRQALAAASPEGTFQSLGLTSDLEAEAAAWLAGETLARRHTPPLPLPGYPFDHRERFRIGPAGKSTVNDVYSRIVSGDMTEAEFAALLAE
jgi:acyl transferase domain-containing protein/ubiquinone/menaquinone biosynthesis C-methylase UbiE